jgi:hypothetical protein
VDGFTIAWLAWLAAFLVIEGVAIARRKNGDTLSEHVWMWFAIRRPKDAPPAGFWIHVRRLSLVAFMAWLAVHFVTGR